MISDRCAALKQIQSEKPVYQSGAEDWWGEVIKRTAVGAGAEPQGWFTFNTSYKLKPENLCHRFAVVEQSLGEIVPRLLHRFASKEGYKMFDDSFSCRKCNRILYRMNLNLWK